MKRILIILLIAVCGLNAYSNEQVENEEVAKAILLFYVSNLIDWPADDKYTTFNIGVQSRETAFANELKKIAANYTVHSRPIVIKMINEFEDPEDIHVIFIDKQYHNDIDQILKYCQKHNILQVTDRLENKRYTVINFIREEETNDVAFEVNKSNLMSSSLSYDDELLLYGGSLNDLRELYSSTKEILNRETDKVIELSKDIIAKNQELSEKGDSIGKLADEINFKKDSLENLMVTINEQSEHVGKQASVYNKTKKELRNLYNEYNKQLESIKEKEQTVYSLDSTINVRESIITNQSQTIVEKNSTIQAKSRTVLLLTFAGSTLFLLGLLIFRAYFTKKKHNKRLEDKVTERTFNLKQSNEELQKEMLKRKQYEADLKRSEQNYREIFNATADTICIYNTEGDLIDMNDAMINMYGYSKLELSKLHFNDVCFKEADSKELELSYLNKVQKEGRVIFDSQAKRKNGELFWVEIALTKTNIVGKDCILSVVRDIDEKKKSAIELEAYRLRLEQMVDDRTIELRDSNHKLVDTNQKLQKVNKDLEAQKQELNSTLDKLQFAQEQLIDSEKMAAIGTMAAGVAHEINNPLNYIRGGVFGIKTVLKDQYKNNEEVAELMDGIDLGVDKAAQIVSSLNHFSRQSEVLDEKCNIHTIIDNCISILQHVLKNGIEVEKVYQQPEIICPANEGKIHQLLLNIIKNAAQAIKDQGQIKIETGVLDQEKMIFIAITDTGVGIKKELLSKVTTPFFTTKDVGEGTGLGLSISKKIVSDHKGKLIIESEPNVGTRMLIKLPQTRNAE